MVFLYLPRRAPAVYQQCPRPAPAMATSASRRQSRDENKSSCESVGCFSNAAEQKCARCQSVFYCNLDCQTRDWKRHKKYCNPISDPAGAVAPDTKSALVLAPESNRPIDLELFKFVRHAVYQLQQYPKTVKKELPAVLDKLRSLLSKGARPDVRIRLVDGAAALRRVAHAEADRMEIDHMTVMCHLCWVNSPGTEALL